MTLRLQMDIDANDLHTAAPRQLNIPIPNGLVRVPASQPSSSQSKSTGKASRILENIYAMNAIQKAKAAIAAKEAAQNQSSSSLPVTVKRQESDVDDWLTRLNELDPLPTPAANTPSTTTEGHNSTNSPAESAEVPMSTEEAAALPIAEMPAPTIEDLPATIAEDFSAPATEDFSAPTTEDIPAPTTTAISTPLKDVVGPSVPGDLPLNLSLDESSAKISHAQDVVMGELQHEQPVRVSPN